MLEFFIINIAQHTWRHIQRISGQLMGFACRVALLKGVELRFGLVPIVLLLSLYHLQLGCHVVPSHLCVGGLRSDADIVLRDEWRDAIHAVVAAVVDGLEHNGWGNVAVQVVGVSCLFGKLLRYDNLILLRAQFPT